MIGGYPFTLEEFLNDPGGTIDRACEYRAFWDGINNIAGCCDYHFGYGSSVKKVDRCSYCGRKITTERDNCISCGAPY